MAKAALVELGVIASATVVRLPLVESPPEHLEAMRARPGPHEIRNPLSHPHPELTLPPPLADNGGVRVVPLGGSGRSAAT
jgi:hypothetical protein